jgi:hypothetical protein
LFQGLYYALAIPFFRGKIFSLKYQGEKNSDYFMRSGNTKVLQPGLPWWRGQSRQERLLIEKNEIHEIILMRALVSDALT